MKSPWSIFTKIERKQIALEQLSDMIGFRVIVPSVEDCYRALGIVHTNWKVVPGRFKDYISVPKHNDYRSIHTTIVGVGPAARRAADPHRGDASGRRIRHRRPRALQGGRDRPTCSKLESESRAFAWLRRPSST